MYRLPAKAKTLVLILAGFALFGLTLRMILVNRSGLTYTNQEYGFQLTITPSWEGYTTRTEPVSGEHQLARIAFYIPTSEDEYSDLPGYVDLMNVHVYPPEKWEEWYQGCMAGEYMCVDREIGRNDGYVFSWSHFNGSPPSDVSMEAVRDMEVIMNSFETL